MAVWIQTQFCLLPKSMFFSLCHASASSPAQPGVSELVKPGQGQHFQMNRSMGTTGGTVRPKPIYFKWGKWGRGSLKCAEGISTLSASVWRGFLIPRNSVKWLQDYTSQPATILSLKMSVWKAILLGTLVTLSITYLITAWSFFCFFVFFFFCIVEAGYKLWATTRQSHT